MVASGEITHSSGRGLSSDLSSSRTALFIVSSELPVGSFSPNLRAYPMDYGPLDKVL